MAQFVKAGTTDVTTKIFIFDSPTGAPETEVAHDTSGIDLWYWRFGSTKTSITEASLASLDAAHSDGGIEPVANGEYRLDLPDAACAAGAKYVLVGGTVTGMVVVGELIHLTSFDPFDAVRMGLTALPNAAADAAGGLPISDAGALDLDTKLAATNEVTAARMGALTDLINGGRLDLILDSILEDTGTTLDGIVDSILEDTGTTLDGIVDAIKAKTDSLTFTVAGDVDCNVQTWKGAAAENMTGDAFARLGAPAGASISADIAAIEAQTDDIGVAGAGLTALAQASVCTEARLSELDAGTAGKVANQIDIIQTDTTTDIPALIADLPTAIENADAVWDEASTGHTDAGKAGQQLWTDVDAILADTNELQVDDTPAAIAAVDAKIDTIDGIVDAILVDTGTTLQAELDGIQADTEDIQTTLGVAGAGLTAVAWNAAWDAQVQSEVFDALDAAFTDATSLTSNGLLDRLRTIGWILRNKIAVTDANGNTVIYKDDSTTPAVSVNGMLTDDSTTTTRLRAA